MDIDILTWTLQTSAKKKKNLIVNLFWSNSTSLNEKLAILTTAHGLKYMKKKLTSVIIKKVIKTVR